MMEEKYLLMYCPQITHRQEVIPLAMFAAASM
jgi:hypothetical protein